MNRKIEFRGKKASNNDWVYGDLVRDILEVNGGRIVLTYIQYTDGGKRIKESVLPETVSQYIGKRDKKENKIYEGDILGYKETGAENSQIYKVCWDEDKLAFVAVDMDDESHHLMNNWEAGKYRWEVLGSI